MAYIFDLDQTIVDSSIAEIYRKKQDWKRVYSLIPQFSLYDGIDEIFRILNQKGEKICIVTSSPKIYCSKVINHFGLQIDTVVTYHDTEKHKPYPEPMLKAIELLQEKPINIISIGDAENDIIASRKAGVVSCLALWGVQEGGCIERAKYVFKTVDDLKKFIMYKGD